LIRVLNQIDAGENTLLILDSPVPQRLFKKIIIGENEYDIVIAHDLDHPTCVLENDSSIGVAGKGDFEGKIIEFL